MKIFLFLIISALLCGVVVTMYVVESAATQNAITYGDLQQKAVEQPSVSISNEAPSTESIYFVGDIMLARDVEQHYRRLGLMYPFSGFIFASSSNVIGNFEASVPPVHVPSPGNTFRFSVDVAILPALRAAGVTHVSLANNHAFDYGREGYVHTLTKLQENDVVPFGHPSVLASSSVTVVENGGLRLGIIAIHTLFTQPDEASMRDVVALASTVSDVQIAYIHWGDEYEQTPNGSQRALATFLSELGVDIIVGHHPHVVQSIEKINDTIVFYSLGNYIFDQYFSPDVQEGLVLEMKVRSGGVSISLIPVETATMRTAPRPKSDEEAKLFFSALAERSSMMLREQIASGTIQYEF